MSEQNQKIKIESSESEILLRQKFFNLFENCPIPKSEMLENLPLFIKRQDLTHIMVMNELYKKILNTIGIIIEFGVRWGRNLALFESFRGMYEPYNFHRKIVGFDTFKGFPSIHEKDGKSEFLEIGRYSVVENYERYLEEILNYHERESPIAFKKKFELIKGDASIEFEKYLNENPEIIVALAYFDFDLYEPTKKCLELLSNHITKGTLIGFDELNYHTFPGETIALKEVFGLDKYHIQRFVFCPWKSYIIIE